VVRYATDLAGIEARHLHGFFEGWSSPPEPDRHLAALRAAYRVVVALDGDRVVGFVNAIGDGVLSAFIPLLEVLPEYRGRGIGSELMRRMLAQLEDIRAVDLCCDAELEGYYRRFGMEPELGMAIRRTHGPA
jgi:ribosomal protein S18 acetylase RimI-like enzyme